MADRSVVVRIKAEVAAARQSLKNLAGDVGDLEKRVRDQGSALDSIGDKAGVAGLAMAAGLGLSAKAAIDWETAWTGVTKTVDGTDAQMAELADGIRELSKELPASQAEIAGVAEAAGQLGIKREDILGFTKTMIDLGESTNLSADTAATAIAQISNVMGTLDRDGVPGVQRFGAALVALGNAGASTESEILDMAQRLAGAGKLVGATESDVLALANAMASMGIEAELGGGAMSRTLLKIETAVKSGGKEVKAFADVAGVSAQEFAQQFENDPIRAVDAFIKGLDRIDQSGGNVVKRLGDLGIEGTQDLQVLLRLKGAGDLLSDSLEVGNQAWEENTALVNEANKRYATTASRLEIARNQARDAAIDFGTALAPALASTAEFVGDLADKFTDLPDSAQSTIAVLAAVTTGSLLLVSGGIKAYRTVTELGEALGQLRTRGPRAGRGIDVTTKSLKGLTVVAAALIAGGILDDIFGSTSGGIGSEQLTRTLLANSNSIDAVNSEIAKYADLTSQGIWNTNDIRSFGDALNTTFSPSLADDVNDIAGKLGDIFGIDNQSNIQRSAQAFDSIDKALSGMVGSGNADEAARQFRELVKYAEQQGYTLDQLKTKFPQYSEALAAAANQQGTASSSGDKMAGTLSEVAEAADGATSSTKKFGEELRNLNQPQLDAREANRNVAQSLADIKAMLDETSPALNKSKTDFNLATEAGREQQAALDGLADSYIAQIEAMELSGASQEELDKKLETSRKQFIKTAIQMGLNKTAAEDLANQILGIPASRETKVTTDTSQATGAINAVTAKLNSISGRTVRTYIETIAKNTPTAPYSTDLEGLLSGPRKKRAGGGPVFGPGTSTSDSIAADLSTGEYVIRARAVQHYGLDYFNRVNAMQLAGGGYAGAMPPATASSPSLVGLEISGVLDLGNGLRGVIRGEVRDVAVSAARSRD